jgi:hypothetical protein
MIFVRTSHVDAGNATAIPREQRRNVANTFSSSGKPCTRNGPLVRSGKTAMQRTNSRERHCATPGGGIVPRVLRPVSGQKHPAFRESGCAIKLDEIISILTFEIARGTGYQHGPALSRVEVCRCRQYGNCIRRNDISTLPGK